MSRTKVRFGDVVRKVNQKIDPIASGVERYVAGEHMDTDEPRILRFGNVGDGYLGPAFHMLFEPGHILYGSRRTYLRKVAMADFSGVCANTTFVLEPSTENLDSRYLLYVMSTERFHQNSISLSKGSTNPYINFSDLASYEFELPSLDEQARIVELLSSLESHIAQLDSLACASRKARATAFAEVLQEKLHGNTARVMRLGDIAEIRGGLTPSMSESRYWLDGEIPWIASGDVLDLSSSARPKRITPAAVSETALRLFPAGTVALVVRSGILAHTLPIAKLPFEAAVNQDIKVLLPTRDHVTSEFLYCSLESASDQILADCRKSGTTVQSISMEALRDFPIVIPKDLGAQDLIVRQNEQFLVSEQRANSSLRASRDLRSSILNSELS